MGEQTKIKREGHLYRVYKLVASEWKLKRTFYTLHQARRYVKGFKFQAHIQAVKQSKQKGSTK